jgi:hypothetical protein
MPLDPTEEENLALAIELKRTIAEDRYPLSPRIRALKGILDKIEPSATVAIEPLPTSKVGDRPRGHGPEYLPPQPALTT